MKNLLLLLCVVVITSAKLAFAFDTREYWKYTDVNKCASYLVHLETGEVLHSVNAHKLRHPASLAKIMTLYIIFDELKKGKLHMHKTIYVSKNAASQPRTNMQLKPGSYITVQEAILALIVKSANDVATAVAEKIGGSEAEFAALMTKKARALGLRNTVFRNASGLPDPKQVTTARDMAFLAIALQKNHPEYFKFFARTSFTFKNKLIRGHNHIVRKHNWATGLKTGYINDSGHNIVTTAKKTGGNLVAVVMGGKSSLSRDALTTSLIQKHFLLKQ